METELDLIFQDYSTIKRLKEGSIFVWVSVVILGILFLPIVLVCLYFAFFGFFSYMNLPEYIRLVMGLVAIYIINVFAVSLFGRPIKVYKQGVDLGTIGSLGWPKALLLGIVYYWRKTKFISWHDIKTIQIEPSINLARSLKIEDNEGRCYHCRIEEKEGDKFYNKLSRAISLAVRQREIVTDK